MSGQLSLLIAMLVGVELFVVAAIVYASVNAYWTPLAERFPPREIAPGAVRRNFQSFGATILNLGWCIHVAADEECMHLRPALFARMIGVRPASIPWTEITPLATQKPWWAGGSGRLGRAIIAGHTIEMPRWCIDLAEPPQKSG